MEQVVSEEYSKITIESNDPDNSLISNYSTSLTTEYTIFGNQEVFDFQFLK